MAEVYSQSQICTTILMPIYYQIKFPFKKSIQVFPIYFCRNLIRDSKHVLLS